MERVLLQQANSSQDINKVSLLLQKLGEKLFLKVHYEIGMQKIKKFETPIFLKKG